MKNEMLKTFLLNNSITLVFAAVVLLFLYRAYLEYFATIQTTDEDDFKLIQAYAFLLGRRNRKTLPKNVYGVWSKQPKAE